MVEAAEAVRVAAGCPGKGRGRRPDPIDEAAGPGSSGLGAITTAVPARLDRLPWSRWHW